MDNKSLTSIKAVASDNTSFTGKINSSVKEVGSTSQGKNNYVNNEKTINNTQGIINSNNNRELKTQGKLRNMVQSRGNNRHETDNR